MNKIWWTLGLRRDSVYPRSPLKCTMAPQLSFVSWTLFGDFERFISLTVTVEDRRGETKKENYIGGDKDSVVKIPSLSKFTRPIT